MTTDFDRDLNNQMEEWFDDSEQENQEPELDVEAGDITTEDHIHFYQYGKLCLVVPLKTETTEINGQIVTETLDEHMDYRIALDSFMKVKQFWPNVFWVSDHGNAHLIKYWEKD